MAPAITPSTRPMKICWVSVMPRRGVEGVLAAPGINGFYTGAVKLLQRGSGGNGENGGFHHRDSGISRETIHYSANAADSVVKSSALSIASAVSQRAGTAETRRNRRMLSLLCPTTRLPRGYPRS